MAHHAAHHGRRHAGRCGHGSIGAGLVALVMALTAICFLYPSPPVGG
jgi:hypothetical protein